MGIQRSSKNNENFDEIINKVEKQHLDAIIEIQQAYNAKISTLECSKYDLEKKLEEKNQIISDLENSDKQDLKNLTTQFIDAFSKIQNALQKIEIHNEYYLHSELTKNNLLAEKIVKLEKERDFYQKSLSTVEERLQKKRCLAQLGHLWSNLLKAPAFFLSAITRSNSTAVSKKNSWLGKIDELYATATVAEAEQFARNTATEKSDLASGLTRLARLATTDDSQYALNLAREAAMVDPQVFRRKWLAFLCFDVGYITEAHGLLASLPEGTNFKASEKNKAEYIAGCNSLLCKDLAIPDSKANCDYTPVPKKVLYVASSSLPYHTTGYTTRTHGLLQALQKEGLEILCVTRPGYPQDRTDSRNAEHPGTRVIDGVTYEVLEGPHRRKTGLDQYIFASADILAEKARQEKVSVIHAASNYEAGLPALMAARKLGIPFVYEVRGLWEYSASSKKDKWEQTERFALDCKLESVTAQEADKVFTLTAALARELVSRGVDESKIALAPNAIDPEAFTPVERDTALAVSLGLQEDDFVIGYAGAIVPYEGLDDLVSALGLLREEIPHAKVLIVGDGEMLPKLRKQAEELQLSDRIIFCGKVPHHEMRSYYSLMDVIALPRKPVTVCHLVSPLKPLEAMAMRIPLIVSDVDALKEMVVDGETALVHIAGNYECLSKVIKKIFQDEKLIINIAENAFSTLSKTRTWKHVASNMYSNLVIE